MTIYQVISTILWLVFGFGIAYLKTRTDIIELAKDQISHAEMIYNEAHSGDKKMDFVVQYIYKFIPSPMRYVFTEEAIRAIVQNVFDSIERYAKTQLDKIITKKEPKEG